jgi:hypothetical protein
VSAFDSIVRCGFLNRGLLALDGRVPIYRSNELEAAVTDTLIGGPEPIYSKTPHRLDVPIKRWSPAESRPASFGTTLSRTICFVRPLAWDPLGRARTGNGKQFEWSTFCPVACSSTPETTTKACHTGSVSTNMSGTLEPAHAMCYVTIPRLITNDTCE